MCGGNAFVHQCWLSQSSGLYIGTQKMHICRLRYTWSYASSFSCCCYCCWLLCTFTFFAGSAAAAATVTWLVISIVQQTRMHRFVIDKRCNCLLLQQHSWAWPFFCIFNFKYHQHHIYVCDAMRISSISSHKSRTRLWKISFQQKKRNGDRQTQREGKRVCEKGWN